MPTFDTVSLIWRLGEMDSFRLEILSNCIKSKSECWSASLEFSLDKEMNGTQMKESHYELNPSSAIEHVCNVHFWWGRASGNTPNQIYLG